MACNYGCSSPFEGNYTISPSGDAQAKAEYFVNSAIPSYASMFYSQTEHESITDIKYDKTTADYDKNNKAIIQSIRGPPLEFYVSGIFSPPDGGSAVPKTGEIVDLKTKDIMKAPPKNIIEEIMAAQKEVAGREIIIQNLEVEEEITIKRRARLRSVRVKDKNYKGK